MTNVKIIRKTYTSAFKRILCLITAAALIFSIFVSCFTANAENDGKESLLFKNDYDVKITISVTNDADGWISAKFELYTKAVNATAKDEKKHTEADIMSNINDENDVYTYNANLGLCFPTKVKIYTDFGGGFTWRKWEADVKIYVNDTIVKAEHILSSSSAFSSSDTWNTVTVDKSRYPYPETINVINHSKSIPELPDDENFFEFSSENNSNTAFGDVFVNACDQYGTRWDYSNTGISAVNSNDSCEQIGNKACDDVSAGNIFRLSSDQGSDHLSRYAVSYSTENSLHENVSKIFETGFYFTHKLTVIINDETHTDMFGTRGKIADLSTFAPTGYNISKITITEGSGKVNDLEFVFGKSDAVLTASVKPNKYTVIFDGNEADSGSMNQQNFTYDTPQKLTNNAFKKTDHVFTGWNTKADGSGTAYVNREKILNMTTKQDDEITLYAQWEYTGPVVTLVYPEEMNIEDEICHPGTGGTVKIDEKIPFEDGSGHYGFVSSDKPLDNITEDQTITLTYEKESHSLDKKIITAAPTCTEKGILQSICTCGYYKESELDALGHLYADPAWEWSDDHEKADALFSCQRCDDVQEIAADMEIDEDENDQIFHYHAKAQFEDKDYFDDHYEHYNIVKFDMNDGYGSIPTQKVPDGNYTVPGISAGQNKKYCSFSGWKIGDEVYEENDTVTAGNMTLTAQWSFTWKNIQKAINAGASYISLTCDVKAENDDTALIIPSGKTVTIDLNGYRLDRNANGPEDNGSVFRVEGGTLTIQDKAGTGLITGGNSINGGAVFITKNGRFAIYSGKITMNTASENGGAVYAESGKVYFWGGEITSNYCNDKGAGIYLDGDNSNLSVSGSPKLISNGSSKGCGGIYINKGTFDISGSPIITSNRLENGDNSNICMTQGKVITVSDTLKNDAVIGITGTKDTVYTEDLKGQGTSDVFRSDDYDLIPSVNNKGELILIPHTHTFDYNNSEWKWSSDNSKAELICKCSECDYLDSHTAQITTENERDKTLCHASCSIDGKEYTDDTSKYRTWNIFVGGTAVTGENYTDILNDTKASYDIDENTLTLNDAKILTAFRQDGEAPDQTYGIFYGEKSDKPFSIILRGTNRITDNENDQGVVNKYGIAVAKSVPYFEIKGDGNLSIETSANDGGIAYCGIQSKVSSVLDRASVIISMDGPAKTTGFELTDSLSLTDSATLSVTTGDDENSCSLKADLDTVTLSLSPDSILVAASGNQTIGETVILEDQTKDLGAVINDKIGEDDASQWDGSSSFENLKYVRLPYGSGPGTLGNVFAAGSAISTGYIVLIIGTVLLIAIVIVIFITKKVRKKNSKAEK